MQTWDIPRYVDPYARKTLSLSPREVAEELGALAPHGLVKASQRDRFADLVSVLVCHSPGLELHYNPFWIVKIHEHAAAAARASVSSQCETNGSEMANADVAVLAAYEALSRYIAK